mmetsp:Transcript_12079/g.26369  ORF Transcript_12079/g.26369 Transcript_12079/m.26369 type:complete len:110 (+) Transcript_12079:204-533(+)
MSMIYGAQYQSRTTKSDDQKQPHLRAICHYGNDLNGMWRCISLAQRISSILLLQSEDNLSYAIECWGANDGHILLSWVDDDVLQGEVGGPEGCWDRCRMRARLAICRMR